MHAQDMLVLALVGDPSREMTPLQCKLSTEEAALFEGGRASVAEFQRWRGSRVGFWPFTLLS